VVGQENNASTKEHAEKADDQFPPLTGLLDDR
jgi:hypothetical protein